MTSSVRQMAWGATNQTGDKAVIRCPACWRLWVIDAHITIPFISTHLSTHDGSRVGEDWDCHTRPEVVDRPDVIAVFMLGGEDALYVISGYNEDGRASAVEIRALHARRYR